MIVCFSSVLQAQPPETIHSVVRQLPGRRWEAMVSAQVPVPKSVAWSTITDFKHQADFIPNIAASHEIKKGDRLEVEQVGEIRFLWMKIKRRALSLVHANPRGGTVDMHAVAGDFKQFDQHWDVKSEEPDTVHVTYQANLVPKGWIPNWIAGNRVRANAEGAMKAIIREMKRRAGRIEKP